MHNNNFIIKTKTIFTFNSVVWKYNFTKLEHIPLGMSTQVDPIFASRFNLPQTELQQG